MASTPCFPPSSTPTFRSLLPSTAGGGLAHLALACDLVIAADNAKFVEVFARRGLVPDALGPWLLPRIIGVRKTMELMLFADLPAEEAAELGLVNTVMPAADLEATAAEWAEKIAGGPTFMLGLTKWLVNQSLDVDRQTMMHNEAVAVELNSSEDCQEGIASFRSGAIPSGRATDRSTQRAHRSASTAQGLRLRRPALR